MKFVQPGFQLRPATRNDGSPVRDLVFTTLAEYGLSGDPHGTDVDLADLEEFYFKHGGRFDVLLETATGRIVGCVGLLPLEEDPSACELRKMYLDRQFRGRGLGKWLLAHALDQARQLGFNRVVLETASVLVEALKLYHGVGFRPGAKSHVACRCDIVLELRLE